MFTITSTNTYGRSYSSRFSTHRGYGGIHHEQCAYYMMRSKNTFTDLEKSSQHRNSNSNNKLTTSKPTTPNKLNKFVTLDNRTIVNIADISTVLAPSVRLCGEGRIILKHYTGYSISITEHDYQRLIYIIQQYNK